jgi:hypothetical protein
VLAEVEEVEDEADLHLEDVVDLEVIEDEEDSLGVEEEVALLLEDEVVSVVIEDEEVVGSLVVDFLEVEAEAALLLEDEVDTKDLMRKRC